MTLLIEDRSLLDAFRSGQRSALERVYRHYLRRVVLFVRHGLFTSRQGTPIACALSPFEVENVVQEIFLRAFEDKTRLRYDGMRPYADFLLGIARHVIIDVLRKSTGREVALELPDGAETLGPRLGHEEMSAEDAVGRKRAIELVQAFVDEDCDARDRQLYELRFVRELTQEQTAAAARLTRIQVRRWEYRFRARLLRHLKRVNYVD
jgi:RNA polymerase sigma factor (sigma-70 family)